MTSAVLGTAIGIIYLAVAIVVVRQVRGSARMFPWLIVLAAFFVVRGLDRATETLTDAQAPLIAPMTDALVLLTLVLLLFGLRRTITDLRAAYQEAEARKEEYARALMDYERLARHRLANPLAALRGGIVTLREVDTLSPREREHLLEMLEQEAVRLANISLDPRRLSPEERALRPFPENADVRDAA